MSYLVSFVLQFFNSPSNSLNTSVIQHTAGDLGGRLTSNFPTATERPTPLRKEWVQPSPTTPQLTLQGQPSQPAIPELNPGVHHTSSNIGMYLYFFRSIFLRFLRLLLHSSQQRICEKSMGSILERRVFILREGLGFHSLMAQSVVIF